MPTQDNSNPAIPNDMLGDQQISDIEKELADLQKNGSLPLGIPTNIGDLVRNTKNAVNNTAMNACVPVVGGNVSMEYIPFTLPASRKAVLLSAFFTQDVDRCQAFADMLKMRGYVVDQPDFNLSLAALRNLPGQDIGVLYLASHATSHGYTSPDANKMPVDPSCSKGYFGLGTEELPGISAADLKLRKSDVDEGLSERIRFDRVGKNGVESVVDGFSARIEFFRKYWLDANKKPKKIFADQSLVFISACDVSDFAFIELLELCGAGTILAWNENIAPNVATSTANYILDLLLGLNMPGDEFFPEKVRQRPFQWGMAMLDIKNHRTLAGTTLGGPFTSFQTRQTSSLLTYCRTDCPGPFLAPSISMLRVDEDKQRLYIDGKFGPDQGVAKRTVNISENSDMSGAKALTVESWDENIITCILMPDTAGYIMLTVDGRTSNCIPLTEWKGQIVAIASGDGSIQESCVIDFSIRLDAHLARMLFTLPLNGSSALPTDSGPGHEDPAEVFTAYSTSYIAVQAALAARASFGSTLHYQAAGSAQYDPPRGTMASLALDGEGDIPWAAMNRSGIDGFDLELMIQRNIQVSAVPALPFDETHDIMLRADISVVSDKYNVERTTTSTSGKTIKENIPVDVFRSILGDDLINIKTQKTVELPDPVKRDPASGGDFTLKTLNVSAKLRFAPDLQKGEDYYAGTRI